MLIKACLNGSRERGEHAALPLTPAQLAQAARGAVEAGAGALHIHPRRADGTQSLEPRDVGAAIAAIRAACPTVPVGVTTAAWIEPDPARRLALIRAWSIRPDFASVNFSEAGTLELCAALIQAGIGVEPGLTTPGDTQLLLDSGLASQCLRLLLEPAEPATNAALATIRRIEALLDTAAVGLPRLLHGEDVTAWPLLEEALQRGYDIRIGLEDTLELPDGRRAADNAQLVALARERAMASGRL
jgi:uncharacterized protein (DUF849 family)